MRTAQRAVPTLERLRRPWLLDFLTAVLAGPPRVVVPEVEHRLAEVLDDVPAIEVDVFHERFAIFAIENDVFGFSGRASALGNLSVFVVIVLTRIYFRAIQLRREAS